MGSRANGVCPRLISPSRHPQPPHFPHGLPLLLLQCHACRLISLCGYCFLMQVFFPSPDTCES